MAALKTLDACVILNVYVTSAPMMLGANAGDYVFTEGGLDNVITMVCMSVTPSTLKTLVV